MAVTAPKAVFTILNGFKVAQGQVCIVVYLFDSEKSWEVRGQALVVLTESKQSSYSHSSTDNKNGYPG